MPREGDVARSEQVLIVSADDRTREAVVGLFRRAGYDAQGLARGDETLTAIEAGLPDLLVLDLKLEDMSGLELCHEIKQRGGDDTPIVLVSEDRKEPLDRTVGLLIGADDYLSKPFDRGELLARARRILSRTGSHPTAEDVRLTGRESEILGFLAEGKGQRTIAHDLFLSPKTVATHIQRILTKLNVHSRAEAVALAYREGIINNHR